MVPAEQRLKSNDPDTDARLRLEMNGEFATSGGMLQIVLQCPALT
jgi:hypothetical protein